MVFNYFSENHHEFWDLGVQIARSPRPEGVRRCPIACWKATFMYFTKMKKQTEKSFLKNIFRLAKKKCFFCGSKISEISDDFIGPWTKKIASQSHQKKSLLYEGFTVNLSRTFLLI